MANDGSKIRFEDEIRIQIVLELLRVLIVIGENIFRPKILINNAA